MEDNKLGILDGSNESDNGWANCLDCEFSGTLDECEWDTDYDEFWGREHKYPVCPDCGGGLNY